MEVTDEIIEKILPRTIDENKIQDQKRSHDLIQMPEIDGELNQPLKRIKLGNLLVDYSDSSESDTSQIDEEPEKNACHICGLTFQTVQEITKHIAGNLHNFCINMCPLIPKVISTNYKIDTQIKCFLY